MFMNNIRHNFWRRGNFTSEVGDDGLSTVEEELRIDSTMKWFDDLNDISGLHIHDGEADVLALVADEVRRQYVVPG